MPWVRLDEEFTDHPKVVTAGPLAMAMQVAALCYCNRNLTDGFVPRSSARTLLDWEIVDTEGRQFRVGVTCGMSGNDVTCDWVIGLLVEFGMWEEVAGGYQIHDYHDYQPTKADVLAERKAKSEAGRKGGLASAARRGQASAQASAQAESKQVLEQTPSRCSTNGQAESKPVSVPVTVTNTKSKPLALESSKALVLVPDLPSPPAPGARGKRIPEDFALTAEMVTWATRETPNVVPITETAKFCDYWAAESGQRATKRDWTKAWQVWMRKADERAPRGRAGPSTIASRSEDAMRAFLAAGEGA